mmetsp:Transcript_7019/g.17308  ORF Transcript_7019/g.17308 Transcript_7019/m.17308 type:complete len:1001 (-) Transcript_7019:94-3096(-)
MTFDITTNEIDHTTLPSKMYINTDQKFSSTTALFLLLVLFLVHVIILAPAIEHIEGGFAALVSSQPTSVERQHNHHSFSFLYQSNQSSIPLHVIDADGYNEVNETRAIQSRSVLDIESSESNATSSTSLSTSSTNLYTNITNTSNSESQMNNSSFYFPSTNPTMAPASVIANSDSPSYAPTVSECRDDPSYVSPINDQNLTCQFHANTNCLQWRHLGLTKFQLQQLLESCPQTCQFDCEAVKSFVVFDDLPVNIQIKNVDGFMDGAIKKHFEEASQRYFQQYFLERNTKTNIHEDATFELDQVELISQTFVDAHDLVFDESNELRQHDTESPGNEEDTPQHRQRQARDHEHTHLRRRKLQSPSTGTSVGVGVNMGNGGLLDVVLLLDGFTIGLSSQQTSDQILLKIKDDRYLKTLKQYDEYFATAEILTAGEAPRSPIDNSNSFSRDPSKSEPSRATVIVSYLVPLSIFAFFFGSAIYYHRSIGPKDNQMETQIGGAAVVEGTGVDGQQFFSLAENTVSPMNVGRIDSETKVGCHASGNLLGAIMTNLRPQSEEDTSSTDQDDDNTGRNKIDFFRNEGRENMPMIVYNIDEDTGRIHDACERVGTKETTKPTTKDNILLQSQQHNRVNSGSSHSSQRGPATRERKRDENHHSSSSLSTESRLDVTGPCNDEDSTVVSQNSVSLTISSFDYAGTSTGIDLDHKSLSDLSQRVHTRAGSSTSLPDRRSLSTDKSARKLPNNHGSMSNTISLPSQLVDVANRSHRPPMRPPYPRSNHQVSRTQSPAPTKDRTHKRSVAMLSLSPITKAMKESTDSLKKSWISRTGSESGHSRNPSSSSTTSDNTRLDSIVLPDIEGQRYELEAPRRGQLGIIVNGSLRNGLSVYAVKDYSPLFGEIHVGDKIIEIDGVDTTRSSLIQITKLLKAKKSSSFMKGGGSGHGGNMPIVVSRKTNNKTPRQDVDTYPSEIRHNRDGSYGSDIIISKIKNHHDDAGDSCTEQNEYVLL